MRDKTGDSFSFNIQQLVAVGGGREAIIGGVIRNHLGPFLEFPVALYWNPRIGEYRLYPILDATNRGARPELPTERRGSPLVLGEPKRSSTSFQRPSAMERVTHCSRASGFGQRGEHEPCDQRAFRD
jgi:hypothetical protein